MGTHASITLVEVLTDPGVTASLIQGPNAHAVGATTSQIARVSQVAVG